MANLTMENLLALDDQNVQEMTLSVFQQQLKTSTAICSPFGGCNETPLYGPADQGFIDSLAVAMVVDMISRISDGWGFNSSVNGAAANNYWQTSIVNDSESTNAIAEAQNIYRKAFASQCTAPGGTGGPFLQDYINDENGSPGKWSSALNNVFINTSWIQSYFLKWETIDQPTWWKTLNVQLYKLMLLEGSVDASGAPTTSNYVPNIVAAWEQALVQSSKSVPACFNMDDLPLVKWLMMQQFQLNSGYFNFDDSQNSFTQFLNDAVTNAENIERHWSESYIDPGTKEPWTAYYVDYGEGVQNWITNGPGKAYCSDSGAIDNVRNDGGEGGGCFVAGTLVTLKGGCEKEIENIEAYDVIVAANGSLSIHSDEKVFVDVDASYIVYGFELVDEEGNSLSIRPFVTAGHLFMTDEGWEAIDPFMAMIENPHRAIGELKPGEWLHRMDASECSFKYKRYQIKAFTSKALKPGEKVYGIYINDGPQSYHANGFLVAMNYPHLTFSRIVGAISSLPEEKRKHVAACFLKALPVMGLTMGETFTVPLQKEFAKML